MAGSGSADINIAGTGQFYLSGTGDSSYDYSLVASQSWFNANVNDPAKQGAGPSDNSGIRITDISETITCTYSNSSPGTAITIVFGNASVSTGDRTVVASGDIQGGSVSATSDTAKTDIPKGSFVVFTTGTAGTFTINTTASYGFIFYIGTDTGLVTLTLTDNKDLANFRRGDVVQEALMNVFQAPSNDLNQQPNFLTILDKGGTGNTWEQTIGTIYAVKTVSGTGTNAGVAFGIQTVYELESF